MFRMKKNKIVVLAIIIISLFQIQFAEAANRPVRIIKPISLEDDTTFVVPEVDLSQLNTPPRFASEVYKRRLDSMTFSVFSVFSTLAVLAPSLEQHDFAATSFLSLEQQASFLPSFLPSP